MTKLTLIDESNRADHYHLTADDTCYFMFEYTAHQNFSFSPTNNLISNLKKKPSESHRPGYQYKGRAIQECSGHLRDSLNPKWIDDAVLVPVPGSKTNDHSDFDDRIDRICTGIRPNGPIDMRKIVRQKQSTDAFHAGTRLRPDELVDLYEIDEDLCVPEPTLIGIIDDILTAGTHYRAMHTVLQARFPAAKISGIFIARRVFATAVGMDEF